MSDKRKKYDFSLKSVDKRSEFIDEKLGFIFDMKPYMLMGYSSESMVGDKKYNRIPKLIDGYTTYFLKSNDAGSSRKTEYSFYTCKRDEMRRKGNQALFGSSEPFDGFGNSDNEEDYRLSANETCADDSVIMSNIDYGFENISTQTIKYAISSGQLNNKTAKLVLSNCGDILEYSKDEELKEMIEQIIFNCYISAKDDLDIDILKMYIKGNPLRDISEKIRVGKSTVDRRIKGMLEWAGQER